MNCDTVCLVNTAVPDDPDSDIFQSCYSGNRPLFQVMADCDSRQQSVFGFCCYPNDSHNSTELCNTEEAFNAWRPNSTETPATTESPTIITVDPTVPAQITTTSSSTALAVTVNSSTGMSTVFVVTKQ